ncbi:hypothetical protein [Mitsuaria sp. GD03876]|uniref:hypothetical protein n=1 Tax=Mitsuaria sp. GD03876 TaxID=2975399 RepID=UPI00244B838C|nr:hypothetical protein [Mitsuaria sp. GD03876]MDH0865578.1 hypothetical protein [Mitsuaria sp. GD03876]
MRLAAPGHVTEEMARQVPDPRVFDAIWQVTQQAPDRVTLMLHPGAASPGRWGFQASQTLHLDEHRLDWELSVRNLSRMPMPARLGWLLQFPEDFAEALWLDDTLEAVRQLPRGQSVVRDPWCGLASLNGEAGRLVLLRGDAPLDTLHVERHPSRAWLQLRLMTPDTTRLTPLARGEELTLRLTIDLLASRIPPPTVRQDKPADPPIL